MYFFPFCGNCLLDCFPLITQYAVSVGALSSLYGEVITASPVTPSVSSLVQPSFSNFCTSSLQIGTVMVCLAGVHPLEQASASEAAIMSDNQTFIVEARVCIW